MSTVSAAQAQDTTHHAHIESLYAIAYALRDWWRVDPATRETRRYFQTFDALIHEADALPR